MERNILEEKKLLPTITEGNRGQCKKDKGKGQKEISWEVSGDEGQTEEKNILEKRFSTKKKEKIKKVKELSKITSSLRRRGGRILTILGKFVLSFLIIKIMQCFLSCFRLCPKGKIWYLVKWQGYQKPTWNFAEDCDGCANRIQQFMKG
jgi:hypothetical protein